MRVEVKGGAVALLGAHAVCAPLARRRTLGRGGEARNRIRTAPPTEHVAPKRKLAHATQQ